MPVSLHTAGHELRGRFIVTYDSGETALFDVADGRHHHARWTSTRWKPWNDATFHAQSELGDLALLARLGRPTGAHRIRNRGERTRWSPWYLFEVVSVIILTIVALLVPTGWTDPGAVIAAVLLAALTGGLAVLLLPKPSAHLVRLGDELVPLAKVVDPAAEDRSGEEIVEAVKAEYGALVSEVIARIESPALFDPTVPSTRKFTELMVRWDHDRGRLRPDQRLELASRLRVAFDTARAHAESLGLNHIPASQRDDARTALHALRLSKDSGATEAERRAALQRASSILHSLMLHYLPTPDELAQLGGGCTRLALPGRITR